MEVRTIKRSIPVATRVSESVVLPKPRVAAYRYDLALHKQLPVVGGIGVHKVLVRDVAVVGALAQSIPTAKLLHILIPITSGRGVDRAVVQLKVNRLRVRFDRVWIVAGCRRHLKTYAGTPWEL